MCHIVIANLITFSTYSNRDTAEAGPGRAWLGRAGRGRAWHGTVRQGIVARQRPAWHGLVKQGWAGQGDAGLGGDRPG